MTSSNDRIGALLAEARNRYREGGDPHIAEGQMAYMRRRFAFYGLKMPQWKALAQQFWQQYAPLTPEEIADFCIACFADEHRELHYTALFFLEKNIRKMPEHADELLEKLILTQSWWDSVDWIAKLTGIHFKTHTPRLAPCVVRWMNSDNFWLQRVCLIFQLRYREQTEADLLFDCISRIAHSKEFFLQKGAGWALREYAKTNPEAVRRFVESAPLAALTRREALKRM